MQDSNPKPKRLSGLSSISDSATLINHELHPSNMTPSDAQESSSAHSLPLQNPSSFQTDSKKDNRLEEEKNPFETEPRGETTSLERPQEPVHLDFIQREPEMNQPEEIVPSQSMQENNDNTPPNQEASYNEEEIARNLHLVLKKLAWFKVWRALVIYLITLAGSVFLTLLREGKIKSYVSVYILAYIFLTYSFTEITVKMLSRDILPWKKMENIFEMINTSIIIIFLIFVQLRLSGINIQTKWVPLLYLLNLIVYAFKTQAPDVHKQYQISKRIIIFIQLFILAVNIDENAGWPWIVCLWLVILCLIFAVIFFIVILTLLIYVIIAPLLNRVVFASIRKSTLILGFLWSILNSSLGISVMTGTLASAIGIDYEFNVTGSIINVCLLTVKILDILLIVLTVPAHNYILDYLVCLDVEKPLYEEQLTPLERIRERSTFVREKKTTYFVKLSSTYFSPLNISFSRKSDVLKKLNRTVNKTKNRRFQRSLVNPEDSVNQDLKLDESISIQDLRKEKSRDKETSNKGQAFSREQKQDLWNQNQINPPKEYHQKEFLSDEDRQKPILSMADIKKVCFSEDLEAQGYSEEVLPKSSENMCYICFEKIPDAIFVECGHGGICIHCALEIVHIKGQCMQCRRNVGKVIRIEPNAQLKDIVKGYETLTIVPNK